MAFDHWIQKETRQETQEYLYKEAGYAFASDPFILYGTN